MKTLKNILSIFLLGLITSVVCSCEDEVEYTMGKPSAIENSKVFFSKNNVYDIILGVSDNEVSILLERADATGALTVDLLAENYDSSIFSIPSSVEFAAGETVKEIKVQVNNMEVFTNYSANIAIPSELVNPYKDFFTVTLNVSKEDFVPYAKGMYTSGFFKEEWEQVLEYSAILDLYRFQDLYALDYDFRFSWDGASSTIKMENAKTLTGVVDSTYGMITAQFGAFKYVPETQTLMFQYQWTVSAGSFGAYIETFEMTEKY